MTRLNWSNARHGPDEFDNSAPTAPSYEFDYRRNVTPGSQSWPERHQGSGEKFGPSLIKKAWKAGLVVVAEIEGFPYPVAAQELRWAAAGVIEVKCAEGWRVPSRLSTRTTMAGMDSTGWLVGRQ